MARNYLSSNIRQTCIPPGRLWIQAILGTFQFKLNAIWEKSTAAKTLLLSLN